MQDAEPNSKPSWPSTSGRKLITSANYASAKKLSLSKMQRQMQRKLPLQPNWPSTKEKWPSIVSGWRNESAMRLR